MGRYTFHGKVFSGIGKGAYYVGHPEYKKKFRELLGYVPFPGTLNVKLSSNDEMELRKSLDRREGARIEEFKANGSTFSGVTCFNGKLNGNEKVTLLMIEITHYDESVMELIAPVYLRGKLGLKDEDIVVLTIEA